MAKPYYLVAYSDVVRISERCNTRAEAMTYCYGLSDPERMSTYQIDGKGWGYQTVRFKQEVMRKLAVFHYKKTQNVLSGFKKEELTNA